jgi:hypothetical protein
VLPSNPVRPVLGKIQEIGPFSLTQDGPYCAAEEEPELGYELVLLSMRRPEIRSLFTDSEYEVDDDGNVEQEDDDLCCRWMAVNLENL